jgi:hypothetical protein
MQGSINHPPLFGVLTGHQAFPHQLSLIHAALSARIATASPIILSSVGFLHLKRSFEILAMTRRYKAKHGSWSRLTFAPAPLILLASLVEYILSRKVILFSVSRITCTFMSSHVNA